MQNSKNKRTVYVGLSGGVDSSVSAYLLKKAGFNVVGVFIKIWQSEFDETCTWKEDRRDAMRVAAHLGIPFKTIDLSLEYKKEVIEYMLSEYKAGRTPNPDVLCNKEIKFGSFLNFALKDGADFVATGHYAKVNQNSKNKSECQLLKAKDKAKEQSYFLWTLTKDQLEKIMFPVGHLEKSEVRNIAKKAKIPTFQRKDSQGLCFIGKVDFKDFLKKFIEPKKGNVLNEKGEIIGHHDGATFFTIGERHGFTIDKKGTEDNRLYVVSKNIKENTITVSNHIDESKKENKEIKLIHTNWINSIPLPEKTYDAQIRYHQEYQKITIKNCKENTAEIIFEKPQTIASGQSVVIYDKDICIGGGVIE